MSNYLKNNKILPSNEDSNRKGGKCIMNEVAIYEGYVITLTKYTDSLVFLSNDENPTKQIINAMIFRTFEKAQEWIDLECSMIVESEISDFKIIPFCCEFKY